MCCSHPIFWGHTSWHGGPGLSLIHISREIADITISEENLYQLVTLKAISNGLMKRIHGNYRFVIGFNLGLILLGVAGVIAPATSALLHNTSTLGISLKSMTNLLNEQEKRKEYEEAERCV